MEPELYRAHAELEDHHWWFTGRRAVVQEVLERRLPAMPGRRILDVGCGSGGMLSILRPFGEVEGMEASDQALGYARKRLGDSVRLSKGELPGGIPAGRRYELITAFDVIEHLDEPVEALKAIHAALVPDGLFLCTVPAYPFLWSEHDEASHHRRRYTAALLSEQLSAAGFRLRFRTFFNSLLFPPIAAARLLQRLLPANAGHPRNDLEEAPRVVNAVLRRIFSSERHLVARTALPFGVSLLALAEREAPHA